MASIDISPFGEALAGNGGADGTLQVLDTTKYAAGCVAWLSNSDGTTQRVKIMVIVDGTHMKAQKVLDEGSNVNSLGYGFSDLSAFTTAKLSRIQMPGQTARVDPANSRRSGI